jgi:hypothetical protein
MIFSSETEIEGCYDILSRAPDQVRVIWLILLLFTVYRVIAATFELILSLIGLMLVALFTLLL